MNVRPGSNLHNNMVIGSNINPGGFGGTFKDPVPWRQQDIQAWAALSSANASTQTLEATKLGVQAASSAVSTGLAVSGVGTPIALAMQASQAIGSAITSGLEAGDQAKISSNYARNLTLGNSTGTQWAESVKLGEQAKLNSASTGATIGAAFGPIGALAGWFIGKAAAPDIPTYQANSFSGSVNPSGTEMSST